MRAYLTLTRRELASFFLSITGYVIIAGLAFLVGLNFVTLLNSLGTEPISMPITQVFFNNLFLLPVRISWHSQEKFLWIWKVCREEFSYWKLG